VLNAQATSVYERQWSNKINLTTVLKHLADVGNYQQVNQFVTSNIFEIDLI
jgi:hypothetical protein